MFPSTMLFSKFGEYVRIDLLMAQTTSSIMEVYIYVHSTIEQSVLESREYIHTACDVRGSGLHTAADDVVLVQPNALQNLYLSCEHECTRTHATRMVPRSAIMFERSSLATSSTLLAKTRAFIIEYIAYYYYMLTHAYSVHVACARNPLNNVHADLCAQFTHGL